MLIEKSETMPNLFVYSWTTCDLPTSTVIRCYGIDSEGCTTCLRIEDFTPYVYIELPLQGWEVVAEELKKRLVSIALFCDIMEKMHLYAAHGKRHFLFVQFSSRKQLSLITWILKEYFPQLTIHENCATSVLQLTSLRSIPMATWLSFEGTAIASENNNRRQTVCEKEYMVKWRNLNPITDVNISSICVCPKVVAFDIEVNSEIPNAMPSNKPNDVIFQISCVIQQKKDIIRQRVLLTINGSDLDDNDLLSGILVLKFENEEQLLKGFIRFMQNEKPNVLIGYNILGFDICYMIKRCERYSLLEEFKKCGFNQKTPALERTIKWSSSAIRNNEYMFIDWEGIVILDLFPIIRRDYKLDNYKLDTVAQYLIGAEKDPVNYKEIFAAYATKCMARVGKYCVQDSNLCIDLYNHINAWISLSEMAVVCKISMFQTYTQGQQLRTYNQVYDYCLHNNLVVTTNGYTCLSGERYVGAYVRDPIPGIYENVVSLDFASMYPNAIISYNICYSTFLTETMAEKMNEADYHLFKWEDHISCCHDPKVIEANQLTESINKIEEKIKKLTVQRDAVTPRCNKEQKSRIQIEINELRASQKPLRVRRVELKKGRDGSDYEDADGNMVSGVICAKREYRFVKAHVKKGVIPTLIQNLLDSRKRVRAQIKTCTDANYLVVLDKKQNAYKISANSQYGAMGVNRGYLPFMPGAMCTTYIGRECIKKAGSIATEKYGAQIIYGDTDSIHVILANVHTPQEIWDEATRIAALISSEFPGSMNIEFEQAIFVKYIILSKKRYMYISCDRDGKLNTKIGKKGIVLARRDNAVITRRIYEHILQLMFSNSSKQSIIDYIIEEINEIFRNRVPYEEYIITKSVGSIYNNNTADNDDYHQTTTTNELTVGNYKIKPLPDDPKARAIALNGMTERMYAISKCPPHVQLAERMRNRNFPIDAGSRMEFVVVNRKSEKLGDKMEDFEYFKKRRCYLSIDKLYYLNSFINPFDQLLQINNITNLIQTQYLYRKAYFEVIKQLNFIFATKPPSPHFMTTTKSSIKQPNVTIDKYLAKNKSLKPI